MIAWCPVLQRAKGKLKMLSQNCSFQTPKLFNVCKIVKCRPSYGYSLQTEENAVLFYLVKIHERYVLSEGFLHVVG